MLHLAIILMLQQAAAPVAPAPVQPAAPVTVVQPAVPAAPAVPPSPLLQVKNVYILPMGSSLDQFLANRLTRSGILQVVTDPWKADAILTDRIGKTLAAKMEELYPDPAKKEAEEAAAKLLREKDEEGEAPHTMQIHNNPQDRSSSIGRAKGTVFLIHRDSRNVIWSIYDLPKSSRPDDLDSVANSAVKNLGSAISKEAKALATASGEKTSKF